MNTMTYLEQFFMHVFQILGRNHAHLCKVRISLPRFHHLRKQKEETNIQAQTNSSQLHKDSEVNKIL